MTMFELFTKQAPALATTCRRSVASSQAAERRKADPLRSVMLRAAAQEQKAAFARNGG